MTYLKGWFRKTNCYYSKLKIDYQLRYSNYTDLQSGCIDYFLLILADHNRTLHNINILIAFQNFNNCKYYCSVKIEWQVTIIKFLIRNGYKLQMRFFKNMCKIYKFCETMFSGKSLQHLTTKFSISNNLTMFLPEIF